MYEASAVPIWFGGFVFLLRCLVSSRFGVWFLSLVSPALVSPPLVSLVFGAWFGSALVCCLVFSFVVAFLRW